MPLRPNPPNCGWPRCAKGAARAPLRLFPEAELGDEIGVPSLVFAAQIIEQRTALVDHHQQPAPAMVVLGVALEMLGQRLNAAGQDRDLDLGRTRIFLRARMFL